MNEKQQVELLTMKYREEIAKKKGHDITCLSDKEIVRIAFKTLYHKLYDEKSSEMCVGLCDIHCGKDWDICND